MGAAAGGLLAFTLAACGGGLGGGAVGLLRLFGETKLGAVGVFALCSALIVGTHAAVCWWAFAARPARARVVATQAPYLLTYATFAVWWPDPWWPLGYLGWAWGVLVALGVVTAWWLGGSRGRGRRSLVYLVAVTVLLGGNGAALGWHVWTRTRGFGLVGEQTPEAAVRALEATSCLSDTGRWYHKAGELVEADCPEGQSYSLRYQGVHDEEFDTLITDPQPRGAFARWWDVQNTYAYLITLQLSPKDRRDDGNRVVLTYSVEFASEGRFMPGDRRFQIDKSAETWVITVERVTFGGWKVAMIEVREPIVITDRGTMP
ncbi:hypothetical protein Cci01nite_82560 [Catellatospora citrea]|uniref:Uncharacterized protein n=1 Tax=Catellatospora citrea TaxID=53366 RepID=A0A8J3KN41_9ACTN|nr:hypothetical protein C8E86_3212 [Catellatospora citrea]GIG03163.1 hypothetical protein Cci01nite_82560 [Catellatospora citrea]